MKNSLFFAGLAAASLLFVGCIKEADVRGLDATPFKVSLNFEQTRTVTDGVKTNWVEGDQINVFHAEAGTTDYKNDTPNVDNQGHPYTVTDTEAGTFTGTLMGGDLESGKSYDWYFFYPYTKYMATPVNTEANNGGYAYIGGRSDKSQTQKGYNSRTHLAGGSAAAGFPLYGVRKAVPASEQPVVTMKHIASAIAVSVKNGTKDPITITEIAFTAPEAIVGQFYVSFDTEPIALEPQKYSASTAVLKVEEATALAAGASATFYMGIKPFTAKSGDILSLKITADAGIVEKEITLPADVQFKAGMVKPINVEYASAHGVETNTLAEILEMEAGADVNTQEVLVVAKYARGVMLAQADTYLLAFNNAGVDAEIGDIVTVSGKLSEYAGLKQIGSPVVTIISSGNEVKLPDPKVLTSLDDYTSSKVELIQYTGTLNVTTNSAGTTYYYNVTVAGSTKMQGSIQYPIDADAVKALDKKMIIVTGFYTGVSSSKYINTMKTSLEEVQANVFTVAPAEINVPASATSATIEVGGNVEWSAIPPVGVTLDKTAGEGAATVTATFAANTDTVNPKEYIIFFHTDAEGVEDDEPTVTITQAKAMSSDDPRFVKVTAISELTDGKYLIVNETAKVALKDAVDESQNTIAVTVSDGVIAATDAVKAVAFTFTASDGAFQGANGKYLAHSGTKNTINPTDTPSENTISISDGNAIISASDDYFIQYNKTSGQERFRYYKNAQTDGDIQLYKFVGDGGTVPSYSFGATLDAAEVAATATEATVNVTGNVAWTASVSTGATVTPAAGTGAGTVKVTFPANTDTENAKTYTVTMTTTADVPQKSIELVITQAKAAGEVVKDFPYEETFASSQGDFTINDVNKPEALTNVWTYDSGYKYMKASAYKNPDNYASESWLISPVVDLSAAVNPALTFSHATNFFTSIDKAKEEATVWVREKGGSWVALEGVTYPSSLSWTFVDSGSISLSAYKGKQIQIGFKYTSTATKAGTWEVKNFKVAEETAPALSFGATLANANVAATATEATVNVTGNVAWTATVTSGATVSPASGTGEGAIKVTFPANTDTENAKTYTVTVATTADVETKSYDLTITQAKAISSDGPRFVKVSSSSDLVSGSYLIVSEEGGVAMKDAADVGGGSNTIAVSVDGGVIPVTDALRAAQFTFDMTNGYIQGPNGKYIGQTSDANGMQVKDAGIKNEISITAEGDADIVGGKAHLRYNASSGESNLRFRYYKSTSYTNQKAIQLYKLVDDSGTVPSYSFGATPAASEVAATATEATVNVTGNVAWTATVTSGATVSPASGTGAGTVKVTFPANTDTENAKTYKVTVSTTADVPTKSFELTITQAKAASTGGDEVYTLTITADDFNTTSYAANNGEHTSTAKSTTSTKTVEVKWKSNQVMKSGSDMQWQKSNGYLQSVTNLGTITSIDIESSAGSFTETHDNGEFKISVGSATGKTSKVTITFTN